MTVHFSYADGGPAACNRYHKSGLSGDNVFEVDCGSCKRTKDYRNAVLRQELYASRAPHIDRLVRAWAERVSVPARMTVREVCKLALFNRQTAAIAHGTVIGAWRELHA